jgi:hypothetical protein
MRRSREKYGELCYESSYNLGDEVQSMAARRFLPQVDYLVDRDLANITPLGKKDENAEGKIKVIYNGWFDGHYTKFPPPATVHPLFVSFHINEVDHGEDSMYDILKEQKQVLRPIASNVEYLRKHEPIGCRDYHTVEKLTKKGIKAYFSGCLTLTLKKRFGPERSGEILVIDAHINAPKVFNDIIPRSIKKKAVFLTQAVVEKKSHQEKVKLAAELQERIEKASLVITSRIHTAFPCLSEYNTPVIFLTEDVDDVRFAGMMKFLKVYTTGDKLDVDLETYQNPFSEELENLKATLTNTVSNWIAETDNNPTIKKGTSIFTACMNRNANLEKALPTWLAANPDEIVIVDWSSKSPVKDIVDKFNSSGKIKLITVDNADSWILTRSFNLAARYTSFDKILKVDCDTILSENFFSLHDLSSEGVFYAGDWRKARNDNEKYTNGIVYMLREAFFIAGGYGEDLTTYGWDDCGLYDRLSRKQKKLCLNLDSVGHIEHSNEERTINQKLTNQVDVEIERNRLLTERNLYTGVMSHFEMKKETDNYYSAHFICSMEVDPIIRQQCLTKAIANREYARRQIQEVKTQPVEQPVAIHVPNKRRIYINAKNGLGNRLRAFASAYVLAQAIGAELILIWIPDEHCGAKFSDLFKTIGVMVGVTVLDEDVELVESIVIKYDIMENEYIIKEKIIYNYMGNKDIIINLKSTQDIYIVSACVIKSQYSNWNGECDFLRKLEPVPAVTRKINSFKKGHSLTNVIGVHIRMGQDPTQFKYEDISGYTEEGKKSAQNARSASHWSRFLAEMKRITKIKPNQKFLVCCDNPEALESLEREMPNNVIHVEKKVYDRSVDQIISALVDLKLLADTKYGLVSPWSSFSEMFFRLSGKTFKTAGKNF